MTDKHYVMDVREALPWVRQGLPVVDRDNNRIGKVKWVQLADVFGESPVARPEEFYRLSPEIQTQFANGGFVCVDCGFFSSNRLVAPDQIEQLTEESLKLNVSSDELVKI